MLNTRVKEFLEEKGFGDRLTEHAESALLPCPKESRFGLTFP